jgi:hypothetical protein
MQRARGQEFPFIFTAIPATSSMLKKRRIP